MSEDTGDLTEQIAKLNKTAQDLTGKLTETAATGEGYAETKEELVKVKADLEPLVAKHAAEQRDADAKAETQALKDLISQVRTPSKASLIGNPSGHGQNVDEFANFMYTLAASNSARLAGGYQASMDAKARLDEMGVDWQGIDSASKATVGDTDAAGGYLVPNPIVAAINMQATVGRSVVDLFNQVDGMVGSSVDLPWEQDAATRAVIALAGATKENRNFSVNNYTATLYTLALIYDVGNQLLRNSRGAAEQLVRRKLGTAFAKGEDYYVLNGSGTNEPFGLLTALGTSGTYVSTFSTPADDTIAGSVAAAIATAAGALETRGATASGVVMNTADFWRMARQGSDEAGFWFNPAEGPAHIDAAGRGGPGGRGWSVFGVPLRHSPNMPSDSLVVGAFADVDFYRGQGYRVDSSDVAGDRWDKNLTGFRGEEEIAFDARPSVFTGHFQRIVNAVGA